MSANQRVRRLPAPLSWHVPGYSVRAETTLGGEGGHPSRRTLSDTATPPPGRQRR